MPAMGAKTLRYHPRGGARRSPELVIHSSQKRGPKSLPCTSKSHVYACWGGGGGPGGYETSLPSQDNSRTAVGGPGEINNMRGAGRAGRMA